MSKVEASSMKKKGEEGPRSLIGVTTILLHVQGGEGGASLFLLFHFSIRI